MSLYIPTKSVSRSNLVQCLEVHTDDVRINIASINNVIATVAADSDNDMWRWVVALRNSPWNYAVIRAWKCDTCGWLHSEMTVFVYITMEDVLTYIGSLDNEVRRLLTLQLIPTQYVNEDKDADGI